MASSSRSLDHAKSSRKKYKGLVEEAVKCPVCLDLMDFPTRIPDCTHVFCRECLLNTQKAGWSGCEICVDRRNNIRDAIVCHHHFRCPVCRKILSYKNTELRAIPPDVMLTQLIKSYKEIEKSEGSSAKIATIIREAGHLGKTLGRYADGGDKGTQRQIQDTAKILRSIILYANGYPVEEVEALMYKAMYSLSEIAAKITKMNWKANAKQVSRAAARHEARPRRANLETDHTVFEDAEILSPLMVLNQLLNVLANSELEPIFSTGRLFPFSGGLFSDDFPFPGVSRGRSRRGMFDAMGFPDFERWMSFF